MLPKPKSGMGCEDAVSLVASRVSEFLAPKIESRDPRLSLGSGLLGEVSKATPSCLPPLSPTSGLAESPLGLSESKLEVWNQQYTKTHKPDNAQTPVHLWNSRI